MKILNSRFLFVIGGMLLLMGCNEKNPLLGEWSLVKTPELNATAFQLAQVSGNAKITFEKNRVTSGNEATEVSYSVNGNEVTVHYTNGDKNTYRIENDSQFAFDIPKSGTFRYERVR